MRRGLLYATIIVMSFVISYKIFFPSYSWRQEMIVTVSQKDGMTSTGSSVTEISWSKYPKILVDMSGYDVGLRGEAAVIQMPDGGLVFALLDNARTVALRVFLDLPKIQSPAQYVDYAGKLTNLTGKTVALDPHFWPLIVTFGDIGRPATVRTLSSDPRGYTITSVVLKLTFQPITRGRLEVLPWLSKYPEPSLCSMADEGILLNGENPDLCWRLHSDDFRSH